MQQRPLKYQSIKCPRCGGDFVCKANAISSCDCMQLTISREEQEYIASRFIDCICNHCLRELKYAYYLIHHHNKPYADETKK